MKRLIVLFGCVFLLLGGCQELGRNNSGVEVFVKDGGEFPSSLAGRWKARNDWQLVFEPNGIISSAIVPITVVEIRPNQTTRVQGRKGEPGYFEAGNFTVYYNPEDRELSVDIKIKQVYLEMGGILKGPWEYLVIGNILEDGKTWQADVFTSLDLAVLAPDPNHRIAGKPKYKYIGPLRADFGQEVESLIFTKVPDGNATNNK
jgi:hypothetical protein